MSFMPIEVTSPAAVPRIFVLESDEDVRPVLKYNLQAWGYQVIIAVDQADAIQRTQGGREQFDLILINHVGQTIDELMGIGRQIRQNANLDSRVPILIMAERYGRELEGKDFQVGDNEYVTYLEDGQQLRRLLQRLCPI
ncbi:MAG: hypothetical protein SFY66_16850 [Oculatellaceae cyanobacterium bins.114]|nr:hypothetical protein [Oculatellaceae cyanobacterium bins.114]